jgi:hypothetical protein
MRDDEPDAVYDGPDARWPEVPGWRTRLAVGITILAIAVAFAFTWLGR